MCKVKRAASQQEPRKRARTAVGRSVNVCISESGTDRESGVAEPRGRGVGVREDGCPTGRGGSQRGTDIALFTQQAPATRVCKRVLTPRVGAEQLLQGTRRGSGPKVSS